MTRFAGDVGWTLVTRVLTAALGVGCSVLVARVLGPGGQGAYASVFVLAQVLMGVSSLGVGKAAVYEMGRGRHPAAAVRSATWRLGVRQAFVAGAAVGAAAWLAPRWLTDLEPVAVACAAPLVVFGLLLAFGQSLLRGAERILACNLTDLGASAVAFAAVATCVLWSRAEVGWYVVARGLGPLVGLVAVLTLAGPGGAGRPDPAVARDLLSYGWVFLLFSVCLMLIYRSDVLMLTGFLGQRAAGLYSVATLAGEMFLFVPEAVLFVLLPRVARRPEAVGAEETARVCRLTVAVLALPAFALVAAAPAVMTLLFGPAFREAAPMLQILVPAIVALSVFQILGTFFVGRGHQGWLARMAGVGLALNVALNLWWIPRWGGCGAAWSSMAAYGWLAAATTRRFVRVARLRVADVLVVRGGDLSRTTRGGD